MELSRETIDFVKRMNGLERDEDVIKMWKSGIRVMEETNTTSLNELTRQVKSAMRKEMVDNKKQKKVKKERRVKKI